MTNFLTFISIIQEFVQQPNESILRKNVTGTKSIEIIVSRSKHLLSIEWTCLLIVSGITSTCFSSHDAVYLNLESTAYVRIDEICLNLESTAYVKNF